VRRRPAATEWSPPPYPPPPVEVTPPARLLARTVDDRRDEPRRGPGRVAPAPAAAGFDGDELADRLTDIERRLARIEAELGALR